MTHKLAKENGRIYEKSAKNNVRVTSWSADFDENSLWKTLSLTLLWKSLYIAFIGFVHVTGVVPSQRRHMTP